MTKKDIMPGVLVVHFKHKDGELDYIYQILGVSKNTETGEKYVTYRSTCNLNELWSRPIDNFLGLVDKEKYPEAKQKHKFELYTPKFKAECVSETKI